MQSEKLPRIYRGYSTEELLKMVEMRLTSQSLEGYPREEIIAMDQLAREYKLTPQHRHAKGV